MDRVADQATRLGQLRRDRWVVGVDGEDLVAAGARRAVVVGVAAVHGLPVPRPGAVEGDGVGVGDDAATHGHGAGVDGSGGAGVVRVDGVGNRPACVGRRARKRCAVAHGIADRNDRLGQLGRDRRTVRVDRLCLVRAGARRAVVLGVAAVSGLPVPGSGGAEGSGVGVGNDAATDEHGAGVEAPGGASVVAEDDVIHRAAGVGRGARESRGVMDRVADRSDRLGQLGRDRGTVLGDDHGFFAAA